MRIGDLRPGESLRLRRTEKATKTEKGGFGRALTSVLSPGEAASVEASSPLGGVEGLLALQEVDGLVLDPEAQRRALTQWGHDILESLEALHLGLLGGTIPREDLETLAALARTERISGDDPALDDLLDQIELRAEVELAKLSQDDAPAPGSDPRPRTTR
ncbi:flagellar assembly protein FliX [Pararhodospirillum photometricum]|uniref:Flagellar assembly protein FliX n=1 Tax=Pararhodospirillum photometricum DSM 122 TaxID=1150469 RepID=H6SMD9_PARPM|nr:flagellar assembly protein FliX [Pararhodospirillum photometricum]CCG06822.1 Putative uncharacterized protein [Pararhodospirillum photometricum DSM 122]